MTKKKLTLLLAGLLLAVGWTTTASAQSKVIGRTSPMNFKPLAPVTNDAHWNSPSFTSLERIPQVNEMLKGVTTRSKAPRRANYTVVADAVHKKSWYDDLGSYDWWNADEENPRQATLTEPVTNPYQMIYMLSAIYESPLLPGIKYSAPHQDDHEYLGCDFGWWVSGDANEDITIDMTAYVNISYIGVYDFAGNRLEYWDIASTSTRPDGWTKNTNAQRSGNSLYGYYLAWNSTGNNAAGYNPTTAVTIPKSHFTGKGGLQVLVKARRTRNNPYGFSKNGGTSMNHYTYAVNYSKNGEEKTLTTSWDNYVSTLSYPVTPPTENGYTVLLVKLKDKDKDGNIINNDPNVKAPEYTMATDDKTSYESLVDYFDTYVEEIQLLTDGLRVGQDDGNGGLIDGGTMFSYTGTLNRFFFISKGKMAYLSAYENDWSWGQSSENNKYYYQMNAGDRAPFYNMYEEFSPTEQDNTTGIDDFYAKMVNGDSYHIKHDCNSVTYMQHYFSMSGKSGDDPKSVSSLVFYIPDNRGHADDGTIAWRNYEENYQPRVGLYTIQLNADAVPSKLNDGYYTITVTWHSSLNGIIDNQVSETYDLYEVIYDKDGNIVKYDPIGTFVDVNTYTTEAEQLETGFTRYYIVKGHPTKASNPDYFYTWSNIDDVTIPGTFDFLKLEKDHAESDFDINGQKNYYRNYLYPTNLAPNTGMTMEQLKQEWPEDQTAKYTLYRDAQGIAVLEVKAVGKKVYYRIKYYKDTQVTDGLNAIPGLNIQYVEQNN